LVNPSIKVRYAEGKIHRVKIVEFAGLEKRSARKATAKAKAAASTLRC
jgi:hypothetical protein